MKVNILEAKTRLSELIRAARAGEEVIIANRGEPVARIVPMGEAAQRPDGSTLADLARWAKENPMPEERRRTAEEIDRAIQEERDDWD